MRECRTRLASMAVLAVTAAFALALRADDPTLEQMDQYAADLSRKDQATLTNLPARELWVAPNGAPEGKGTKESPLSLAFALSSNSPANAGTVVWLKGGTYSNEGPFVKTAQPCGTPAAPLIFRAAPGDAMSSSPQNHV